MTESTFTAVRFAAGSLHPSHAEHDILKLLDVLLLNEIEAAEKKQVLQRDFIFP